MRQLQKSEDYGANILTRNELDVIRLRLLQLPQMDSMDDRHEIDN